MPRARGRGELLLVLPPEVDDALHASPVVLDVVVQAPPVADFRRVGVVDERVSLQVRRVGAGEEDRALGGVEQTRHHAVVSRVVGPVVEVAAVQLERVDLPRRKRLKIHFLVALDTGVPAARLGTRVAVQPKLEAAAVHVVGQELDPPGKAHRVGHLLPVDALLGRPAVVDVDVLVPDVAVSVSNHLVRHVHVQLLADAVLGVVCAVCEERDRNQHNRYRGSSLATRENVARRGHLLPTCMNWGAHLALCAARGGACPS